MNLYALLLILAVQHSFSSEGKIEIIAVSGETVLSREVETWAREDVIQAIGNIREGISNIRLVGSNGKMQEGEHISSSESPYTVIFVSQKVLTASAD
eukprot:UN26532